MANQRPNPDQLLKHVQAEESAHARGKLKLFFGACPGVGKTYAMLEAARQRKKEGVDVVIGLVETHGRAETAALLEGLEVLSRCAVEYRGVTLQEFDLEAALKRRPALILVDELAHTNAPGSRHAKRWQDVEDLLETGIDVYTALNVQHWESLNDVVAQITGVIVQEKVPDTFLESAHDLELVDLPPEELLQRLKEGKVYRPAQAGHAADHFFQPGNLIALRELALRHTAERVDAQMRAFKESHAIAAVWPVAERIVVGVTASPLSARLIRAANRLATRMHAPWTALHVETPSIDAHAEDRARVVEHLRLAEKLGGETVTLSGRDVTEELLAYARSMNATKIVIGKPAQPRWRERLFGSIVNEMARRCGDIDLYVISGVGADFRARRPSPAPAPTPWPGIAWGAGVVIGCTLLAWTLFRRLELTNLVMLYLLGVTWISYRYGRIPALVASVLSVLSFDFFFVPPMFTFAVSDTQYLVTFAVMLIVGILISTLTSRLQRQTLAMRGREERLRRLHRMSRVLSETPNSKDVLAVAARELNDFYGVPLLLLTPNEKGELTVAGGDAERFGINAHEFSVAAWAMEREQRAGRGTDTLSGAKGFYIPLRGSQRAVGVLGLVPSDDRFFSDPEQLQLLETFATEIGGALESTRLSEAAGRAELQMEVLALSAARPAVVPKLSALLDERRIVMLPPGLSRERIIKELVATLQLAHPTHALQAILERERAGTAEIAPGLVIPHARLAGLAGIRAALGVNRDEPARLWLVFLGPADNPQVHLGFLASLAAFFAPAGRIDALQRMSNGADILAYIRNHETAL